MKISHLSKGIIIVAYFNMGFLCNYNIEERRLAEPPQSTRIYYCDRNWYLFGINYPWSHYGHDFGLTAWGHNGVSAESTVVDADFQELASCGIRTLRWFLFADGRASPEYDSSGYVTGFDSYFYNDMDAALSLAQKHGIYIMFTLFDFYLCDTTRMSGGVQLGGHSEWVSDIAKRQSLMDNALIPMLQIYGTHPNILAWEIMNEPEWVMQVDGGGNVGVPVTQAEMQGFASTIAQAVHEYAPDQLVTVGCAYRKWLDLWQGLGLDFYQYHYYDWMEPWYPFDISFDQLGLDKPCIIGEFPTTNSNINLDTYLERIWSNDYAGAFGWSYKSSDEFSNFNCQPYLDWRQTYTNAPVEISCQ